MWYKILGVSKNATIDEVNVSYLNLCKTIDKSKRNEIDKAYKTAYKKLDPGYNKRNDEIRSTAISVILKVLLRLVLIPLLLYVLISIILKIYEMLYL